MDEKKGLARGPDGLLHWRDLRDQFYTKEEQRLNDFLAELIGAMVLRRRQLGLTQEQLAEKAGVKQSAIARLETGNAVPRLDTLIRIADALDLRLKLVPEEAGRELSAASEGLWLSRGFYRKPRR
ncbi:XRE family transcriptional regulator [Kyrpidia spormannii]|uniref:XRE family transcriptional regulator n=1 Tax=Kyrpidia spormannii TaxID=2055160 RepID=A0A2K8N558_9BACL|nr:helix-turn-helix transcriptional regulator [Kyrpidia spormannii]ATY84501.1 XRE family transcriptional regulator [Kyrpidia spormannii]